MKKSLKKCDFFTEFQRFFEKGLKRWDAGKMKKGVPGLRPKFCEAKLREYGTLGDCFFSFAVAGTRDF